MLVDIDNLKLRQVGMHSDAMTTYLGSYWIKEGMTVGAVVWLLARS
jgi:hypothetical protein